MADLTSDKIARILLEDFDDGLAQLRGAPRIRVALQIRHLDSDGIWHPGETRDIGAKGFSARFSTRPPRDAPIFLQIHAPREGEYPWIDVVGEVVWCRAEANGVVCGIAFVAAPKGAVERLARLLSSRLGPTGSPAASAAVPAVMRTVRSERKEAA